MMKAILILLVGVSMALAWDGRPCPWNHGHGRPGCQTQEEMTRGCWRHNWDPTAFWQCEQQGQPGVYYRCPVEQMFDVNTGLCINWANWVWTWECDPPSFG